MVSKCTQLIAHNGIFILIKNHIEFESDGYHSDLNYVCMYKSELAS